MRGVSFGTTICLAAALAAFVEAQAPESAPTLRSAAVSALARGIAGYPEGAYEFDAVFEDRERPADSISEGRAYFRARLVDGWRLYHGVVGDPPPATAAEMDELAGRFAALSEVPSTTRSDEKESFRFSVGPDWLEFRRALRVDAPKELGWKDPRASLWLQATPRELVCRYDVSYALDGTPKTDVDSKRHAREPGDFERVAATRFWTSCRELPRALAASIADQNAAWRFRAEAETLVAEFSGLTPSGPWPTFAFTPLAPSGARFVAEIDAARGVLLRLRGFDSGGAVFEETTFDAYEIDARGALPLRATKRTWWPGGARSLRSSETYVGRRVGEATRTSSKLFIPVGALVHDFRTTPPVVYREGPVPATDASILELSAAAAEAAASRPKPARSDAGVAARPIAEEEAAGSSTAAFSPPSKDRSGPAFVVVGGALIVAGVVVFLRRGRGASDGRAPGGRT
jgi:hypothetical protein